MTAPATEPDEARAIIEALLLTAVSPVTPARLAAQFPGVSGRDIRAAIGELNRHYQTTGHAFEIIEVAGGYQLANRPEYGARVRRFHRERKQVSLSQAALETLSIVAFKQPVTRVEVDSVRGVSSAGVLHTLMDLDLVRMVGRSEGIGKPMLFGTTREFLVLFGLKSLGDLPQPKELAELLAESGHQNQAIAQPDLEPGEAPPDAYEGQEVHGENGDQAEDGERGEGGDPGEAGPAGHPEGPEHGEQEAAGDEGGGAADGRGAADEVDAGDGEADGGGQEPGVGEDAGDGETAEDGGEPDAAVAERETPAEESGDPA